MSAMPSAKSAPVTTDQTMTAGVGFHLDVNPSAGNINVQLANANPTTWIGVQKYGRGTGTVTILAPSGQTMGFEGGLVSSIVLVEPWEFVSARWDTTELRYEFTRNAATLTGHFSNNPIGGGNYINAFVGFNINWASSKPIDYLSLIHI